jgi:uncharacterized protein (TIRG00374 family)
MHGVPVASSAPVVIAERIADLLALLILSIVGVALYGVAVAIVIAAGAVIGLGLVVLAWPALLHRIGRLVTRPRKLQRFRPRLEVLIDGLSALSRPTILAWSTALSIAAWLCECVGFALIISAFPGADVPFGLATLIYASTTIAGALSFLPGGLGVTEGGMTILLVQSGHVEQAVAVAATLLIRLATLWFGVLLGVVLLAIARGRIAREAANSEAPSQAPRS